MIARYLNDKMPKKAYPGSEAGDDKWYKDMFDYVMGMYLSSHTSTSVLPGSAGQWTALTNSGYPYGTVRDYAFGCQDINQYIQCLDPSDPGSNEGLFNINWKPLMILPKYIDLVRGKGEDVKFEPSTIAVDEMARKEKDMSMARIKFALTPQMQDMQRKLGLKPSQVADLGMDEVELQVQEQMGGLRLSYEILMRDALGYSIAESKLDSVLDSMLKDDLIMFNKAAIEVLVDVNGDVTAKYIDPAKLIIPASVYPDHCDAQYAGYFEYTNIGQLRREQNITADQAKAIINAQAPNTMSRFAGGDGFKELYSRGEVDGQQVMVGKVYWLGTETDFIVEGVNKDGRQVYDKVGPTSKLTSKYDRENKKITQTVIQYCYHAKVIMGCDVLLDYGKVEAQVREGKPGSKKAMLPIVCVSDPSPSLVERCIPMIDDIHIALYKMRNAIAKIPPGPRQSIDFSLMQDTIVVGGKKLDFLDLINIFQKTGILGHKSISEYGDEYQGASRSPISPIAGNYFEDVAAFSNEIAKNIELIQQVTGMNAVVDGTSSSPDMLKGVQEGLKEAGNNALLPTFRLFKFLFERSCVTIVKKWEQVMMFSDNKSVVYTPFGASQAVQAVLDSSLGMHEFGVLVSTRPSGQQSQQFLANAMQKRDAGLISAHHYIIAEKMVMQGQLEKAGLYLSIAESREKFMAHERQKELTTLQAKAQAEGTIAINKSNTERDIAMHELKMKEIDRQGEWDLRVKQAVAEGVLQDTALKAGAQAAQMEQ